jgi:multiple sugar transport system permease protein
VAVPQADVEVDVMRVLRYGAVVVLIVVWILPLYLVLANASTPSEEYAEKPIWALPTSFGLLENMVSAWQAANLGPSVFSTFLYAVVGAAAAVLVAALAAFAIVALRVRHGFAWFMLIYSGTIFPFQMYLGPLFDGYSKTGLYDTRMGLLLLYTAIAIPFATFVIRNHFSGIPIELSEAARLDGAASRTVFWRIYMPLSTNALAAVFVFQFTWVWNEFLFGLTLSRSSDVRPIMTALAALQGQYASTSIPVVLAGALAVSVPTLVLFIVLQRLFVQALAGTGR